MKVPCLQSSIKCRKWYRKTSLCMIRVDYQFPNVGSDSREIKRIVYAYDDSRVNVFFLVIVLLDECRVSKSSRVRFLVWYKKKLHILVPLDFLSWTGNHACTEDAGQWENFCVVLLLWSRHLFVWYKLYSQCNTATIQFKSLKMSFRILTRILWKIISTTCSSITGSSTRLDVYKRNERAMSRLTSATFGCGRMTRDWRSTWTEVVVGQRGLSAAVTAGHAGVKGTVVCLHLRRSLYLGILGCAGSSAWGHAVDGRRVWLWQIAMPRAAYSRRAVAAEVVISLVRSLLMLSPICVCRLDNKQ